MIHQARRMAKAIKRKSRTGDPLRHARGVIVSSTVGTSVVTIDGGTTHITVTNYQHTKSLSAGVVVDVLLVGNPAKGYIIGHY
jgi:hypothetical protein